MSDTKLIGSIIAGIAVMMVLSTLPAYALAPSDTDNAPDPDAEKKKKIRNSACAKLKELITKDPENNGLQEAISKVCAKKVR